MVNSDGVGAKTAHKFCVHATLILVEKRVRLRQLIRDALDEELGAITIEKLGA